MARRSVPGPVFTPTVTNNYPADEMVEEETHTEPTNVTKSSLIREYLQSHPHLGPTAMAQALSADYPDKKFTAAEISAMKTKLKGGSAPAKVAKVGQMVDGGMVGHVVNLKHAIEGLGKAEVQKLVEVL
jgi:hypothetical protein